MDAVDLKEQLNCIESKIDTLSEKIDTVKVKNGRDRTWMRAEFDQMIYDKVHGKGWFERISKPVIIMVGLLQIAFLTISIIIIARGS